MSPPRPVVAILAAGVLLRLAFAVLARDVELQSDEGNYVYLALVWNRLGTFQDCHRYLWPPGYPFLIGRALAWFDTNGLLALRVFQSLASLSIGASVAVLARRLFGGRAALVAAAVWAGYLPLIGFTHTFWPETVFLALFLPAIVWLVGASSREGGAGGVDARVLAAGIATGLALYFKESPGLLAPLLALALWVGRGREGLRRGSLYLLAVVAVALPWALRNAETYGARPAMAASLGENAYGGLNAEYKNYDLRPFDRDGTGALDLEALAPAVLVRTDPAGKWPRRGPGGSMLSRSSAQLREGLRYAAANPGWLLRSRVQKLADLLAPYSFFVRHIALDNYAGTPLGGPVARRLLTVLAMLGPLVVLPLAVLGLCLALGAGPERRILLVVIAYFLATGLLVASTRFRVPLEPLAIVLAAGFVTSGAARASRGRIALAALGTLVLLVAWFVSWPQTRALVGLAWGGGS